MASSLRLYTRRSLPLSVYRMIPSVWCCGAGYSRGRVRPHKRQLLFNRPPIFRNHHQNRTRAQSSDFSGAREILEARLDQMVGLAGIKAHLTALLDTLEMDERRRSTMPEYLAPRGCMHMVFLGNPGTGKTAVAQLVACVLSEIGVLRKGHLVVAKKADLLGRYSNHGSRNTRAVVESALGGVLLLDEAYALLQGEVDLGLILFL